MFGRKSSDAEKRLEVAKAELVAAQANVAALIADENAAAAGADTYATWRSSRDAATTEVERLTKLIGSLSSEIEELQQRDAEDALRKRTASAKKTNEALARRIRDEGGKALDTIRTLMRDVATAAIEDAALDEILPDGAERPASADAIARGRPALMRKEIEEKKISLWVFSETQNLVGDQDAVVDHGGGRGMIQPAFAAAVACEKRAFLSRTLHPEERAQRAEPFFAAFRLPHCDGPGTAWDGTRLYRPEQVVSALDEAASVEKTKRPVETELIPLDGASNTSEDAA